MPNYQISYTNANKQGYLLDYYFFKKYPMAFAIFLPQNKGNKSYFENATAPIK